MSIQRLDQIIPKISVTTGRSREVVLARQNVKVSILPPLLLTLKLLAYNSVAHYKTWELLIITQVQ